MARESTGTLVNAPDDETRMEAVSIALYMVAGYLIFVSLADMVAAMSTKKMFEVMFRYGAIASVSRALAFPVIGYMLVLATAARFGHRRVRQIFLGLTMLTALFVMVVGPLHVLDALQGRALVPGDRKQEFLLTSVMNLFRLGFAWLALVFISVAGFRVGRWDKSFDPKDRSQKRKSRAQGLVLAPNAGPMKVPTMESVGTGESGS